MLSNSQRYKVLFASVVVIVVAVTAIMAFKPVASSRGSVPGNAVVLHVIDSVFDGGRINPGDSLVHTFIVKNIGPNTVHIENAIPSCGCTSAIIGVKVLNPGDSASVRVRFSSLGKGVGPVEKSVKLVLTEQRYVNPQMIVKCIVGLPEEMHPEKAMNVDNIFKGECQRCHVDQGRGFFGQALYAGDCAVCHESAHSNAPKKLTGLATHIQEIIEKGKPGSNMPAFSQVHGGPLTPEQIASLVEYLKRAH